MSLIPGPPHDLTFDSETHTYSMKGRAIPSVTTILEVVHDFRAVDAATLDSAREFGTHVHEAIALDIEDALDWQALDDHLRPYVQAARKFIADMELNVLAHEHRVVDSGSRFAGTLDLYGGYMRRGRTKRGVFDFKTGSAVPVSTALQTAAYARCMIDPRYGEPARFAVHLRPDGRYKVIEYKDSNDFNMFLSCLNVYNYREGR